MARSKFGGVASAVVYEPYKFAGRFLAQLAGGVEVTFWDAETGGNQYTDLLLEGQPVGKIPSKANGFLPLFEGPDLVKTMWADATGNGRFLLITSDAPIDLSQELSTRIPTTEKGAQGGVATLDSSFRLVENVDGSKIDTGTIPAARIPDLSGTYAERETYDVQPAGGTTTSGDVVVIGKYNAVATDLATAGVLAGGTTNYENVVGAATTANVNTGTSNLPTATGIAANWSFIFGGYDNVVNGSACIVAGYHNKIEEGSSHNTIAGGSIHSIPTGIDYSTISGGNQNTVTGDRAFVGGGQSNEAGELAVVAGGNTNGATGTTSTVAGGSGNTATATSATVSGGTGNDATADYSYAGGGQNNLASGQSSYVGGGSSNTASNTSACVNGGTQSTASGVSSTVAGGQQNAAQGTGATVPGGRENDAAANYSTAVGRGAKADVEGSVAHASSYFSVAGDAQNVKAIHRREVTGDFATELYPAGAATPLILPDDTTWHFDIMVVGRCGATGESAAYRVTGCIDRGTGAASTALVGTPTKTDVAEDIAAWDVIVDADASDGSLRIRAAGEAGKTIRWVARTELVCVST